MNSLSAPGRQRPAFILSVCVALAIATKLRARDATLQTPGRPSAVSFSKRLWKS